MIKNKNFFNQLIEQVKYLKKKNTLSSDDWLVLEKLLMDWEDQSSISESLVSDDVFISAVKGRNKLLGSLIDVGVRNLPVSVREVIQETDWSVYRFDIAELRGLQGFYPVQMSASGSPYVWSGSEKNSSFQLQKKIIGLDVVAVLKLGAVTGTNLDDVLRDLVVHVDGVRVSWDYERDLDSALIAFSVSDGSEIVSVELSGVDRKSPLELGVGSDRRKLSFAMQELLMVGGV